MSLCFGYSIMRDVLVMQNNAAIAVNSKLLLKIVSTQIINDTPQDTNSFLTSKLRQNPLLKNDWLQWE